MEEGKLQQYLNKLSKHQKIVFDNYKEEKTVYEHYASQKEFLRWYQQQTHPNVAKPVITVNLVCLRWNEKIQKLQVMLYQRDIQPFRDKWSLPGTFLKNKESLNHAVERELSKNTNANNNNTIIRLPAVSNPNRDPRMWVITNPHIILFSTNNKLLSNKENAQWFNIRLTLNGTKFNVQLEKPINKVTFDKFKNANLAFDHEKILAKSLIYLLKDLNSTRYLPLISELLKPNFTLSEFRFLSSYLDKSEIKKNNSNLYRKYKDFLLSTNKTKSVKVGKPFKIYHLKNNIDWQLL